MTLRRELTPIYSNQKSFYGKANVLSVKTTEHLISYDTFICSIDRDAESKTLTMSCEEHELTTTTLKHLKEFMLQNNFEPLTKKQVVELIRNNDKIKIWYNS